MKEILKEITTVYTWWTTRSSPDNIQAQACRGRQWGLGRGRSTSVPMLAAWHPIAFHTTSIFFTLWGEVYREHMLPSLAHCSQTVLFLVCTTTFTPRLRHTLSDLVPSNKNPHKETQMKSRQHYKEKKQRLTETQSQERVQCYDGWEQLSASRAASQRGKLPVACYSQRLSAPTLHCCETGSLVCTFFVTNRLGGSHWKN